MNLISDSIIDNIIRADISGNKMDVRLSLSLKREFWVAKLNSVLPAALPAAKSRHFQAYCIGTPRSGTHSLAHMFQRHYNSAHEPAGGYIIYHLLKWMSQQYSYSDIKNVVRWRDKKLSLDLEAAHYLHHIADVLADSFPQAKFIFTVRDPLSWLESEINRNYGTRHKPFWREIEDYRYGRYGHPYTKHDTYLQSIGLYPISSYLAYWKDHNQSVLDLVPADRLLTMETREIRSKVGEIGNFLDIDPNTINVEKSHSDKRKKQIRLSEITDTQYLHQQIEQHCSELIETQFPKMKEAWYQQS
ncbi:MAG: sulfotransferase [Cyanobacteria bacterium J06648_16]